MRRLLTVLTSCLLAAIPLNSSAQVVPDNTLPSNTIVMPNGKTINIGGGTVAGENLFHSFEQFSLLIGETAFFDNALTIENIISRVTGDAISDIDGLIRANGTANLFLINPNGIIFGENASLDLGGSFIGSTADSIEFADGSEFSATNPSAEPLLTVSIPIGLQYGSSAGDITVQGTGNNLSIDPDTFTVDRSNRPEGLEVGTDRTLALVGGNVFLPGGNLTTAGGQVELGSVDGNALVKLTPDSSGWSLSYDEVVDFQNISLSQAASIEVSGNSGGNARLQGATIEITDGSAILADVLGDGEGGSLEIKATEAVEIAGAANNFFPTLLSSNVDLEATGDGGNLSIASDYLLVADGGQVNVNTFGLGNAGNLTVEATEIEVIGESANGEFASGLFAQADFGETGDGGDLSIATDFLLVAEGAQISATTFGLGDAGNLNVTASEIKLSGASGEFASGLFVATEAEGNGGSLTVATGSLLIADGAEISSTTFSSGDAGNLTVTASEIKLSGGSAAVGPSGFFANVEPGSSGSGGNLSVATTSLSILDGAQISALTNDGFGDAGTININAEEINLVGTSPGGIPSGLFATVISSDPTTSRVGGDLSIVTDRLQVTEGAQIATSTFGSGSGGDLQIVANELIRLNGTTDSGSSGVFATALAGDGSGGNINVTTNTLEILDGATISVSNFPSSSNSPFEPGTGAAGNLSIAATELTLSNGMITADTFTGDRGNINIQTDLLFLQQNSTISTNAQGTATGGNISINASEGFVVAVPQENNDITANAVFGQGGNVDIVAQDIIGIEPQSSPTPFSDITASSEFGIMGSVTLKTQDVTPSAELIELSKALSPAQLNRDCLESGSNGANNSRFVNTGRGGMIPQSGQTLDSNDLLGDVGLPQKWSTVPRAKSTGLALTSSASEISSSDRQAQATPNPPLEAQSWLVNDQGNIELVTAMPEEKIQFSCEL